MFSISVLSNSGQLPWNHRMKTSPWTKMLDACRGYWDGVWWMCVRSPWNWKWWAHVTDIRTQWSRWWVVGVKGSYLVGMTDLSCFGGIRNACKGGGINVWELCSRTWIGLIVDQPRYRNAVTRFSFQKFWWSGGYNLNVFQLNFMEWKLFFKDNFDVIEQ